MSRTKHPILKAIAITAAVETIHHVVRTHERNKAVKEQIEYEKELKKSNALDFDDLLMKTYQLFEKCPEVLQKYQNRFKYIFFISPGCLCF